MADSYNNRAVNVLQMEVSLFVSGNRLTGLDDHDSGPGEGLVVLGGYHAAGNGGR